MCTSYFVGKRKHPIGYQVGRLAFYFLAALAMWGVSLLLTTGQQWLDMGVRTPLLLIYITIVFKIEHLQPLALLKGRPQQS